MLSGVSPCTNLLKNPPHLCVGSVNYQQSDRIFCTAVHKIFRFNQICKSNFTNYKNIFTQIHKTLQNEVVFEGGLKLQFSHKFSVKDYVTPVLLYNKNMVFFPNLDSDQSFSFIIEMNYNKEEEKQEEYIINEEYIYLQASLLYKRGDNQKIVRVYNLCFPISHNYSEIYFIKNKYNFLNNFIKILK